MIRKYILFFLFYSLLALTTEAQTFHRLTNLPHVYINTFNGRNITSKDYYVYATMYYVDETDQVTVYDSLQIRGRGNSTWNLPKKPYKLKFNQKEKLLGQGYAKAKKWTLLANAGDKTLMRNAVSSLMGDFLGLKNNPAHHFVDFTLNGSYVGCYQISDQVEVRPHRVNITEQDYPLTASSDITGGYLLEIDGFYDEDPRFRTSVYNLPVRVHYPEADEISSSQLSYIQNYLREFESVLASNDFADAEYGYRNWVDSTSLVNWYIATEVSGNVDGFWSTYIYKDQQDPRIFFGPLWDFDIAYNNDNRADRGGTNNTENQLMVENGYGDAKKWVSRMWDDPWFGHLVTRRYSEVVNAGLEDYLYHQIDSISNLLQESQALNYERWGIRTRVLRERVLYSSYDQYVDDLKSYIATHMAYLRSVFQYKEPVEPTPAFVPDNCYYTICNVKSNTVLRTASLSTDAGDLVCGWSSNPADPAQQWRILPVGNYFMLVNRHSGMALNDPTVGEVGATTNVGTQLNTSVPDADDDSQLWTLTPQGMDGYYNLTNKRTQHTANLSGGSAQDGTSVLSYTTDSRNAESGNRLWYIVAGDEVEPEPEPDAIASVEPAEYALAYDAQAKVLHFGAEAPQLLNFSAKICTIGGVPVRTFRVSDRCSVADLASGVYLVVWSAGGKTRSAKLFIR